MCVEQLRWVLDPTTRTPFKTWPDKTVQLKSTLVKAPLCIWTPDWPGNGPVTTNVCLQCTGTQVRQNLLFLPRALAKHPNTAHICIEARQSINGEQYGIPDIRAVGTNKVCNGYTKEAEKHKTSTTTSHKRTTTIMYSSPLSFGLATTFTWTFFLSSACLRRAPSQNATTSSFYRSRGFTRQSALSTTH